MNPSKLIDAKLGGASFDRIVHAIKTDREQVSKLPEDLLELYDSMLSEINAAVDTLGTAIKSDDRDAIKATSRSLREIFQMLEDSCDS